MSRFETIYLLQQFQNSSPNRNSTKNNVKIASTGTNTSSSWSKYKRGSTAGNISPTKSNLTSSTVIVIDEFDADVFRQLVEYVHTGCVTLQPRTLLGMLIVLIEFYGS